MPPLSPTEPPPHRLESAIAGLRDALAARRADLSALVAPPALVAVDAGERALADAAPDLWLRDAERELLAELASDTGSPADWRSSVVDSILILALWHEHRARPLAAGLEGVTGAAALDAFQAVLADTRDQLEAQSDRTDVASRDVHELLARALFRLERVAEAIELTRTTGVAAPFETTPPPSDSKPFPREPGTNRTDGAPRKGTREVRGAGASTRVLGHAPARGSVGGPSARRTTRIAFASLSIAAAATSLGYGLYASRAFLGEPAPATIAEAALEPFFPGAHVLEASAADKAQKRVRIELSSETTHAPPADVQQRMLALCKFLASTRYERAVVVDRLNHPVATWTDGRLELQGRFAEAGVGVP